MDTEVVQSFPIAETFTSVQGEGMYAGTRMFFIRLAGCNVGEYINMANAYEDASRDIVKQDFKLFDTSKHSICTSATGQRFLCDTDYHKTETVNWFDLADRILQSGCWHINFTGGEPMLHNLSSFVEYFTNYAGPWDSTGPKWHIETSGTKFVGEISDWCSCVTCSPKRGFLLDNLRYIHQLKFVVGNDEELLDVRNLVTEWRQQLDLHLRDIPIYISPVAPVSLWGSSRLQDYIDNANNLTNSPNWHPAWRLNLQQHKILGVR